jgi:hypothetical protein
MDIPAPGHPVSPSKVASLLDDCKHLQTLVASNDVVFLLTDTWEGKWLPTLLCANENKVNLEHLFSLYDLILDTNNWFYDCVSAADCYYGSTRIQQLPCHASWCWSRGHR